MLVHFTHRRKIVFAPRALVGLVRLLLCCFAFVTVSASAERNKALVIGVSQYTQINSLRYADADALEFSQVLTDFAEYDRADVTLLLNQQATKKQIVDEINRVVRESEKQPLASFIFMFAGHGVESTIIGSKKQGDIVKQETNIFLAPSDASTDENNFYMSGAGGEVSNETFINKAWLARQLSAIKAKSIFIILDSCYSGTKSFGTLFTENEGYEVQEFGGVGGKRGVATTNKRGLVRMTDQSSIQSVARRVAYLASSRNDQASVEYDELRHGALSYAMFQYLKNVRRQTHIGDRYTVSIEDMYDKITTVFRETKVNGSALDASHQPLLIPIPDLSNMKDMHIFSVPGIMERAVAVSVANTVPNPVEQRIQTVPAASTATSPPMAAQPEAPVVTTASPAVTPVHSQRYGLLNIETAPSGLEIFIDGEKVREKSNVQLKLAEGRHSVELYLPSTGYRYSFTADISESQPLSRSFSFYGQLGISSFWLMNGVKSSGPPVDILINGKQFGSSNRLSEKLLAGTHELTVSYKNVTKTRQVEVRPDSPLHINYSVIREAAPAKDKGVSNVAF